MNRNVLRVTVLGAVLASGVIGCSQKNDPESELKKAANAMEQAAPAASTAPAQPAPTPVVQPIQPIQPIQPTQPTAVAAAPPVPPAQQMNQAMASYKAGNYEDAVTRLQQMRTKAAMTPQQRMALQDAMAAVMTEVYTLAAKGDARAIQAVKQYEQMRNARR